MNYSSCLFLRSWEDVSPEQSFMRGWGLEDCKGHSGRRVPSPRKRTKDAQSSITGVDHSCPSHGIIGDGSPPNPLDYCVLMELFHWSLQGRMVGRVWGPAFPREGMGHQQSQRTAGAGTGNEHREAGSFWALGGFQAEQAWLQGTCKWAVALTLARRQDGSHIRRQSNLSMEQRAWPRGDTKLCVQEHGPSTLVWGVPAERRQPSSQSSHLLTHWPTGHAHCGVSFLGRVEGMLSFCFISQAHPLLPMKVSSMCKAMACSWQRRAGVGCIFVVIYTKELLNLSLRTVKLTTSFNCLQFFSTLFFYLGVCSQDLLRLEI